MFDFFGEILGFVSSVFQFFVNLVESLIQAVVFMASGVGFATAIVPFMPSIIGTAIVIFLAIFVIKFLIGR